MWAAAALDVRREGGRWAAGDGLWSMGGRRQRLTEAFDVRVRAVQEANRWILSGSEALIARPQRCVGLENDPIGATRGVDPRGVEEVNPVHGADHRAAEACDEGLAVGVSLRADSLAAALHVGGGVEAVLWRGG